MNMIWCVNLVICVGKVRSVGEKYRR